MGESEVNNITRLKANKRVFNFTKKAISALPPRKSMYRVYDTKVRHLAIYVQPSGSCSFYLYLKKSGRVEQIWLGKFPELSIENARKQATKILGDLAQGVDVAERRRQERAEMTFGELFELFITNARQHLRKKTWKEYQKQYDLYLKPLKNSKLRNITKQRVASLHAKIGKNAPYSANRALSCISSVFGYANRNLDLQLINPAEGVQKFKEKPRERYLSPDEMSRFLHTVATYPDDSVRDYIMLSLLTGQRQSNVLQMRWDEVDLTEHGKEVWCIPSSKAKSGQSLIIPLVPAAVDILNTRLSRRPNADQWAFPSSKSKSGCLGPPVRAWRKICKSAGVEGLRMHDIRRTTGSWMAAGGSSLPIIGRSLGHKSTSATQIYAKVNVDPVREAMGNATNAMMDRVIKKNEKPGDVKVG